MKYCSNCGAEYQDSATECSDCSGSPLLANKPANVANAAGKPESAPPPDERDTRRFLTAGTTEDPMFAEQIGALMKERNIPVFVRARRGGSVDSLSSASPPWWEILVPEDFVAPATELFVSERAKLESTADEASRAAEEEEQETEAAAKAP